MKRIFLFILLKVSIPANASGRVLPLVQPQDSAAYYLKEATILALNDFPKAIALLEKADSLASIARNQEQLADITYAYGVAYYVKGDYGSSLNNFLRAEELYSGLGNKLGMAKGLLGQGLIQQGIDRNSEAIDFFRKAIALYKEAGNYAAASPAYANIAISEIELKQYKKAKENLYLAIDLSKKSGRKEVEHIALNRLGEIYLLQGNPEAAIEFHNKVLFDNKAPNNWEKSFAYAGLAQVFAKQGKITLAEEHGLLAMEYADKSHSLWDLERNTAILSDIYREMGATEKALEYLELNAAYKDSLYDQEKLRELNFLRLESTEAENQKLQTEKELAEKRLLVNRVATFFLVLLIVFLVLLLVIFRKKKKQKESFHREMEEKNWTILEQNELIQERNSKLDVANKAKDRLFSILSHDLRSPIGSIQQLLEMMKDGEFTLEEQSALLDEMHQQISGTSFMLNNLLTWASSQLDGSKIKPEEVFLPKEVDKVLQAYVLPAKQKRISIIHKPEAGGRIRVDKAQLSVILHNLISNAIKFTVEGKNILICYQERNQHIEMVVADGGLGISQEKIEEILTASARMAPEIGTNRERGTGLGLLVVKEFLKVNNAELHIKSSPGQGSEFTVSFPKVI